MVSRTVLRTRSTFLVRVYGEYVMSERPVYANVYREISYESCRSRKNLVWALCVCVCVCYERVHSLLFFIIKIGRSVHKNVAILYRFRFLDNTEFCVRIFYLLLTLKIILTYFVNQRIRLNELNVKC